ncbi:MAG: hypothetical protein RR100_08440 [Comamonas sp.]
MQVQHCFVDGEFLHTAPQLRLVQGLSHDREQARLQVRAALRSCLAQDLGCPEAALQISNQRNEAPHLWLYGERLGQPFCSISHAPGLALLAWHDGGPVGVDIQAVNDGVSRRELLAVAQIFLAPNAVQALDGVAQDALFFKAFASAWATQEARLKCAGVGLVEWSAELETSLACLQCTPVALADGYAGTVAWHRRSDHVDH